MMFEIKVNSFPNDKFWEQTKLKADDKSNVASMMIFIFERVENIAGKGEKVSGG